MRTFRLTGLCFFAASLFVGTASAAAVADPGPCQAGSLASYISTDSTGGCTIGDLTFFRFDEPAPTTVGSPTVANASQILLTPIQTGTGAGFIITANGASGANLFALSSTSGTQSVNYFINYSVDPTAPIIGGGEESISGDPSYGNTSVTQTYCTSDVLPSCTHGTISQLTVTPSFPTASVVFPNPSSFVDIATDVFLSATPENPSGLDPILAAVNEEAATPEPSLILATAGLFGFLIFLRRKLAKSS